MSRKLICENYGNQNQTELVKLSRHTITTPQPPPFPQALSIYYQLWVVAVYRRRDIAILHRFLFKLSCFSWWAVAPSLPNDPTPRRYWRQFFGMILDLSAQNLVDRNDVSANWGRLPHSVTSINSYFQYYWYRIDHRYQINWHR